MTADGVKHTSMLSALTAQVANATGAKNTASRKLTPVAGEVAPPPRAVLPHTKAPFPNDVPQEVVEQQVAELTRVIGNLTEARDALAALIARPVEDEPVDLDAVRKAKEAEGDARIVSGEAQTTDEFKAEFAAKQEAAQAATFKWVCPVHGEAVTKTSTKTGREYRGCPNCNQFQR